MLVQVQELTLYPLGVGFEVMEKKCTGPLIGKPNFGCLWLERPKLKRGVLTGKECGHYSGGWPFGEKADACPKAILWFLPGTGISK